MTHEHICTSDVGWVSYSGQQNSSYTLNDVNICIACAW